MFGFLSRWLEHRRRKQAAVEAAVQHFDATTGNRAHSGGVIGEKSGNLVVRVCHGNIKPPGRAWYLVGSDGSVVAELSFDEAQEFGEGLWK
jgi:hypothetical protein